MTIMKKICVCVLILLATCSNAFAAVQIFPRIQVYDKISPINLTISTFEPMDYTTKTKFTEAMRHFAVAIHEMTNGAHQLGRIKIVQRGALSNREFMHIDWIESQDNNLNAAFALHVGSYIPFTQNTRVNENIQIEHLYLRGFGLLCRNNPVDHTCHFGLICPQKPHIGPLTPYIGPIDTGYVLAHEAGHFIYGLFDEFEGGRAGFRQGFERWRNVSIPKRGDSLADGFNSIMRSQRSAIAGSIQQRAAGLMAVY